jgi:Na+-transporting methylmalonyl-CoA/oxaloacetate decarboxylase beta subunit
MDSIGIIGGADGPTQIVVTSALNWYEIAAIVLSAVVLAVIIIRAAIKRKRHNTTRM